MDLPINKDRVQQLRAKSKMAGLRDALHKLNYDVRIPITQIINLTSQMIEERKEEVKVRSDDIIMIKESAESIISIIDGVLSENADGKKGTLYKNEPTDETKAIIEKVRRKHGPMAVKKRQYSDYK